ncbi:MAG: hypothetical protein Q9186_001558 [Xanthomendoza sp. 1 TL-2023]
MLSLPSLHPPSMPLPTTSHYNPPPTARIPNTHPPNPNQPSHPQPPTSPHLTTLRHDELQIQTRKSNIRRFGAGWLRPPGLPKTLQGLADERAEREEQELNAQREQAMMDAQAAAEEEAEGAMMVDGEGEMMGQEGEGEEEMRDLDDEVPDAQTLMEEGGEAWESGDEDHDAEGDDDDGDEENSNQENEGLSRGIDEGEEISIAIDEDVMGLGRSFNGAGEEGEGDYDVPGMLEGEGRDLDGDVPEAGSYQHTDTELEDESSAEEGGSFVIGQGRGVLGRSVWGGSPMGVMAGGAYDGATGCEGRRRRSRRTGERSSRGRLSRD